MTLWIEDRGNRPFCTDLIGEASRYRRTAHCYPSDQVSRLPPRNTDGADAPVQRLRKHRPHARSR